MAETRKPTILLVAGAWLPPATYEPFLHLFKEAGFPTLSVSYPSFNPTDPQKTDVAADSRSIRDNVLYPLVEEDGKEVVIIMHSYGGMPGSVAAKGLGERQRRKDGKPGGVLGLIFISAFVIQEGASVADGQGGNLPPWVLQDDVSLPVFSTPYPTNETSEITAPPWFQPAYGSRSFPLRRHRAGGSQKDRGQPRTACYPRLQISLTGTGMGRPRL